MKYGLDKLGYVHVDMDGGWFNFARGHLNASGYPHDPWEKDGGMRGVAQHLHAQGLKLGMYVTGGFLAVYQHEDAWAEVRLIDCIHSIKSRAIRSETPTHACRTKFKPTANHGKHNCKFSRNISPQYLNI